MSALEPSARSDRERMNQNFPGLRRSTGQVGPRENEPKAYRDESCQLPLVKLDEEAGKQNHQAEKCKVGWPKSAKLNGQEVKINLAFEETNIGFARYARRSTIHCVSLSQSWISRRVAKLYEKR